VSDSASRRAAAHSPNRFVLHLRNLTGVGALNVAVIIFGGGLLALQLALLDKWLIAAASMLLAAGVAMTAFKVHRTAVASFTVLGEHRRNAVRISGRLSDLRHVIEGAAGQNRLQQTISSRFAPSAAAIEASSVEILDAEATGRQAAAVTEDAERPQKLFAATSGMGFFALHPEGLTRRPIAGIVSPILSKRLAAEYALTRLHPGMVLLELDRAQPSAIVLEEDALNNGVWAGAMRATGTFLFSDIQRVLTWAKVRQQTVYVLPTRSPQLYTDELRRQASYVVRSGLRPPGLDADVELPLLESLIAYVSDVALSATKSADLSRRPIAG
jgi:hypothetical protein